MNQSLRTRWDLLRPDIGQRVRKHQATQKDHHDQHARARWFTIGQSVMARNFRPGVAWIPGTIVQQLGPLTYLIDVGEGRTWKCHVDHVKEYGTTPLMPESEEEGNEEPFSYSIPTRAGSSDEPMRGTDRELVRSDK